MTPELTVLTFAALLQVAQFVLMAVPARLELGTEKMLGPRDHAHLGGLLQDQLSPRTARLYRAFNNHFEGLVLFAIAVMVVSISGQSTGFTAACAWVYLIARIAYVPAYALGLVPWRSLVWSIGFAVTVLMLVSALI